MPLIKTYTPDNAEGAVKQYYDRVLKQMPFVPKPLQMMSASPELLGPFAASLGYLVNQPNFNPALLGFIRYLVSSFSPPARSTATHHPTKFPLLRTIGVMSHAPDPGLVMMSQSALVKHCV